MKQVTGLILAATLMLPGMAVADEKWDEINTPYYEVINEQSFSPPDPMTSYGFKDDVPWTFWNKSLLASAVGANLADIVSTQDGLDRGCTEANPLYGDDPNVGTMVLIKAVAMGVTYYLIENHTAPENRQEWRNWGYGAHTLVGGFAAVHNYNTDCY